MNKLKIVKFVLISSIICRSLIGNTQQSFSATGSMDYKETYGTSHITHYDMSKISEQQNSAQFKVPQFDASTLKTYLQQKVMISMVI